MLRTWNPLSTACTEGRERHCLSGNTVGRNLLKYRERDKELHDFSGKKDVGNSIPAEIGSVCLALKEQGVLAQKVQCISGVL